MTDETIKIHEASFGDIPRLVSLLRELFEIESDFTPSADLQKKGLGLLIGAHDHGIILVARANNETIGMCSCQYVISTAEGSFVGLVEDVIVTKEYRRRGIGRLLLEELEKRAKQKGLKRLQLLTDVDNEAAFKFYYDSGWRKTSMVAFRRKWEKST